MTEAAGRAGVDKVFREVGPDLKPKPEAPTAAPAPAEESWESLEPHAGASEAQKSQFRQLKDVTKRLSSENRLLRDKLAPLLRESGLEVKDDPVELTKALDEFGTKLQQAKSSTLDPQTKAQLDRICR